MATSESTTNKKDDASSDLPVTKLPTTIAPLEINGFKTLNVPVPVAENPIITAGNLKSTNSDLAANVGVLSTSNSVSYNELGNYRPEKLGQKVSVEQNGNLYLYTAVYDSKTNATYWAREVHDKEFGTTIDAVKYKDGKLETPAAPQTNDKMGPETKEDTSISTKNEDKSSDKNTKTTEEAKDKDKDTKAIEEATPMSEVANSVPAISSSITSSTSPSILTGGTPGNYNGIGSGGFEGKDLFETVAKLSNFNSIESITFSDGVQRKIDCFLVSKYSIDQKNTFHLSYGKDVKNISISQSVSSYGIFSTIDIHDVSGHVSTLANYCLNYYFVVSIFNVTGESGSNASGYMVQPYIFEIDSAAPISPDGDVSKVYRFKLKDIVSATLEKVAVGNLLLEYPSLTNVPNFGELYNIILNYAGLIINYLHDKKYCIDCKIYFLDDNSDSYNEIVRGVIFQDIKLTMDCYSFLNYVYQHAAKELSAPAHFTGENPGNLLVPLFLQDEVPDIRNEYCNFFQRSGPAKPAESITFDPGPYSTNGTYIKRNFYAKNLLMPFELAFTSIHSSKKSVIYESINPVCNLDGNPIDIEKQYLPMNGYVFSPIEDSVDIPPKGSEIGLGWKNLVLFHDSPGSSGNILIFFNWIYDYYHEVFLNKDNSYLATQMGKYLTPAIDPHFHAMERAGLTGGDEVAFAKMNANTITLKTSEPIKEALYYAGRSIKSYVMMNSLHGFKIKGDLLRHPGEIIKISSSIKNGEDESPVSLVGGLAAMGNLHNLIYTNTVTHLFDGNTFKDLIYANRICNIDIKSYQKQNQDDNSGSDTPTTKEESSNVAKEIVDSTSTDGESPDQGWNASTGASGAVDEDLWDPNAKPEEDDGLNESPDNYTSEEVLKDLDDEETAQNIPNNNVSPPDDGLVDDDYAEDVPLDDTDVPVDGTCPPWLIDDVDVEDGATEDGDQGNIGI